MIKKFLTILLLFFGLNSAFAVEQENIFNQITGINFISRQITQAVIERELKDELHSKFKATLEIFSVKSLKNGEFKSLTLKSKQIAYKALFMSDFEAQTINPYNQIIYKNNRLYYPENLEFEFKSTITNSDIQNSLNSYEFKRAIDFDNMGFKIKTPNVEIKNNKLYFQIPITTFLSSKPFYVNLCSDLEISNNKIVLKDITFFSKSNIIKNDIFGGLLNKINPVSYQFESINTKYCKIYITNVKIEDDKINIQGLFIINKNYGE